MVEPLENRRMLHGSISGGVLTFLGLNIAENITVTVTGTRYVIHDDTEALTQKFAMSKVKEIIVQAYGGNDSISISAEIKVPVGLDGGDGNDTLTGGSAGDMILGGFGNDKIDGGAGNDTLKADEGNDILLGGGGNDSLRGGDGKDKLDGGAGADTVAGDAGADTADYSSRKNKIILTLGDNASNDGEANEHDFVVSDVENVLGSSAGDMITGSNKSNRIDGRGGNDTIHGGAKNDTLFGGAGDDSLFGDDGNDQLFGGDGNDRLDGNAGPDSLHGDNGNDSLFARDNNKDFLDGGDGTDTAKKDSLDLLMAIP